MWCGVSMCVRVHAKSLVKFEKLFLDNKLFPRTFPPATAKIKKRKLKITKMDAKYSGEECLITTYCEDFSQGILSI